MKTYLMNVLNKYNWFSESLDIKATLCNKSWLIFNDLGYKELYVFLENGELITSNNGVVTNAKWRYLVANKTLVLSFNSESYMFHPSFVNDILFVLRQDGIDRFLFLIDESRLNSFRPKSILDLESYFKRLEQQRLEQQKLEQQKLEQQRLESQNQLRASKGYKRAKVIAIVCLFISIPLTLIDLIFNYGQMNDFNTFCAIVVPITLFLALFFGMLCLYGQSS